MDSKEAALTIPSLSTELPEVKDLFDKAKKAGWNVLIPETLIVGLADNYALAIAQTTISVDLADGEIYPDDNAKDSEQKRYRLHKTALMRISGPYMAGVKWSAESGIETLSRDYIAFKSIGSILAPDGQEVPFVGHDDLDFLVLEEKYREAYAAKAKNLKKDKEYNNPNAGKREATEKEKAEYIDYCVKRDLMQKREHKLAIVETGAMERVIRGLVGLKNSYTMKQLRMPFITARVILRPDYSNPETKNRALAAGNHAAKNIYGTDKPPIDIPADQKANQESVKAPVAGQSSAASSPTDQKSGPAKSAMLDFENSDDFGQNKAITDASLRKGYDLAGYLKRANVETITAIAKESRIGLFNHILSLPDKKSPSTAVPY